MAVKFDTGFGQGKLPVHGVWTALRWATLDELTAHVAACVAERNAVRATVKWQFTLAKARFKLDRHYQKIRAINSPD